MKRIRTRITVTFIVLIGVSFLASGILAAKIIQDSHLDALRKNMQDEIGLILSAIKSDMTGHNEQALIDYYSEKARMYKELTHARITFIRQDGEVLGDSDHSIADMDNHLAREEIQQLLSGQDTGESTRFSNTISESMMYVASRVYDNGEVSGYLRMAYGLEEISRSIYTLWLYLIAGLLILFIVAGLVIYRLAFGFTRPIERITAVAKQITRMNYQSRVHLKNNDEIGQLGDAINTMADSLQEQMNRILESESQLKSVLANMNSGIIVIDRNQRIVLMNRASELILGYSAAELMNETVDQLKQPLPFTPLIQRSIHNKQHIQEETLLHYPEERTINIHIAPLQQNDHEWMGQVIVLHDVTAIRKLENMRSEFVANVSHELKTPVAAVKGFAETLLTGNVQDKETAHSFLKIIYDESERLNRLIADILQLSKIESRNVPLQFSPLNMHSFLSNLMEIMEREAGKKNIRLVLDAGNEIFVEADEDRLKQVFMNLLSNGINYTPDGGKVSVKLELTESDNVENDRIRIIVSDTGMGIPKKDLPRIFERFYRVDKARSRSSGGTGLGLSIVKHLVELHHGTITVESEVGWGSKFIVELPVVHLTE